MSVRGILVGVDGSPLANSAVDWAAREAALRGVALTVVTVCPPMTTYLLPDVPLPPDFGAYQQRHYQGALDAAAKVVEEVAREGHDIRVHTELLNGQAAPTMVVRPAEAARGESASSAGRTTTSSTAEPPAARATEARPAALHPARAATVHCRRSPGSKIARCTADKSRSCRPACWRPTSTDCSEDK